METTQSPTPTCFQSTTQQLRTAETERLVRPSFASSEQAARTMPRARQRTDAEMQELLGETSSMSTQEKAARAMFAEMDTDDSGALDSTEFQCKCSDYGLDDSSIQQLFVALDANRDGEIRVEEFVDGWAKFNEMSRYFTDDCKAEEVPFAALSDEISAAFATGTAVLVCDPSGKSSSFLQYKASVMDCKGIFVLDKIHGKEPAEIQEKARSQLVAAMKGGQWLHMELGKSAPAIGEVSSLE
eukprot:COSAG06_NODE_17263_length_940_cov_1.045721_1_plen_241_part_10